MNPTNNESNKIDVSVSFLDRIYHVGRGFIGLDVRGSKNMFSGIYSVLSWILTFDLSRRKRRDVRKGINMFSVQPKIKEALGGLYVRALSKHNQFFCKASLETSNKICIYKEYSWRNFKDKTWGHKQNHQIITSHPKKMWDDFGDVFLAVFDVLLNNSLDYEIKLPKITAIF